MTTQEKLNNVLGYLIAMSFDKPELSNALVEPLNTLSEAISEVENLSLSGVVNCLSCGKNHAELCGSCVFDIAQGTAEQAISSR